MSAGPGGIVCAGDWIVDTIYSIDAWPAKSELALILDEMVALGGGPGNVAMDLHAFGTGLPIHPVGLIGRDARGRVVREACAGAGLPTQYLAVTELADTAHTLVMNVAGDSRTFFYYPGANDLISEDHMPVEAVAETGARLFYLGYIGLLGRLGALEADGTTGAARVLARAQAAGMLTCADLVSVTSEHFATVVRAALPHLDYLFLNEVEAARATGLAVRGPDDAEGLTAAAEALKRVGAGTVIVHTPALALWCGPERVVLARIEPVPPEEIVSPVGAGDAFCAGVLFGIHHGWGVDDCLMLGRRAASACLAGASATEAMRPLSELMPEHPPLREG